MSVLTGRRTRVTVILVIVGCLLVAAIVDRSGAGSSSPASDLVALGPRVPTADSVETAWYCAEGTANPGGRADEQVLIANLGRTVAHARITVMQGPDLLPKVQTLNVGPGALARVPVASILPIAEPGVLVEVAGSRAVVTHAVAGNGDSGVGPCARDAAPQWHFAAGTTVKGAQLWLALFNPFADDAIVDITFVTQAGPLAPGDLQGYVVPGHSRVSVPVHDNARRDTLVSTEVTARRGRVVAEQTQLFDGSDGRSGLALSLGAPELATHWEFANGFVVPGRTQTMVMANPSSVPTNATIRTRLDGGVLEPETVSIAGGTAVAVDLGRRVPPGVGFSVAVRAPVPIIAESLAALTAPSASADRGIATAIGASTSARHWVDSPARVTGDSHDSVAVLNAGGTALTFRMVVVDEAGRSTPPKARRIRLAAGKRAVLDLGALEVPADAFVEIFATAPVVVERESSGMPGVTVAGAVPDLGP